MLCASLALSGCATTMQNHGYKVEGKEYVNFEDLDDDHALKMVVMLYNAPAETYEESVAKHLSIEKYTELLKKRNSKYLKNSGVYDLKYEKIDIKKWTDEELLVVYDTLDIKSKRHKYMPVSSLTEEENTKRIVHLTAVDIIAKELKGRANTRQAWGFVANALAIAASIAVSII